MKLTDKQTVCWYSALSLKPKLQYEVTEIKRKIKKQHHARNRRQYFQAYMRKGIIGLCFKYKYVLDRRSYEILSQW